MNVVFFGDILVVADADIELFKLLFIGAN